MDKEFLWTLHPEDNSKESSDSLILIQTLESHSNMWRIRWGTSIGKTHGNFETCGGSCHHNGCISILNATDEDRESWCFDVWSTLPLFALVVVLVPGTVPVLYVGMHSGRSSLLTVQYQVRTWYQVPWTVNCLLTRNRHDMDVDWDTNANRYVSPCDLRCYSTVHNTVHSTAQNT